MSPSSPKAEANFVVATPARSVCDNFARALEKHGLLRFLALGTRRGTAGVSHERTRLKPSIGLAAYAASRIISTTRAESFRFRLHPRFDKWVKKQLQPGDHVISSFGYVNDSFRFAREQGGKTFLDGGNSHPRHFWDLLEDEHRRWNCELPPIAPHHHERSLAMMADVDYVLSPSQFVTQSFLDNGFTPDQILKSVYPVDLSCFQPAAEPRPKSRPLRIISTGTLSLRKGSPYLLEAFDFVRKKLPQAEFLLTRSIQDNVRPILEKHGELPIDWAPSLPHDQLAERYRSADIFVLPSLEEGLVRTALEAMACGLPVILTPNTGANDFVEPGVSGEVVPIRDARAIADAILKWADIVMACDQPPQRTIDTDQLSVETFERNFSSHLDALQLNSKSCD